MKRKRNRSKPPQRSRNPGRARGADPFAERESQKYARPIPSREAIVEWLEQEDQPVAFEGLARELKLTDPVDVEALNRRLGAMLRDGQLVQNRRDEYCLVKRLPLTAGTVIGHR